MRNIIMAVVILTSLLIGFENEKPKGIIMGNIDNRAPSIMASNVQNVINFRIYYDPDMDRESGILRYKIYTKTAASNKYEEFTSGSITVTSGYQNVVLTLNNGLYSIVYTLQNGAGLWSQESEETVVDLRGLNDMVDTLYNNPNPFNSSKQNTTIYYTMLSAADVAITIYDMFGYVVKKWNFLGGSPGGQISNAIAWDGTNEFGKKVSKGGYILILKTTDTAGNKYEKKYLIGLIR